MIDKDRWYWCTTCKEPCITFFCCRNSSCNGGGCDKCKEESDEVDRMFENNEVPKKEDIPHTKEQLRNFHRNELKKIGYSDEEIDERFKKADELDRILRSES